MNLILAIQKITTCQTQNSNQVEILLRQPTNILVRKRYIKGNSNKTEKCAFCGHAHIHGEGDGLRAAHCSTGSKISITAEDGTELFQSDGYIIKTIN